MRKILRKINIILFIAVLFTTMATGTTLARFETTDTDRQTARAASFDLEIILPDSLVNQPLTFYSSQISQIHRIEIKNNSEVSVVCYPKAKANGFAITFLPSELVLMPGETGYTDVEIMPLSSGSRTTTIDITVTADQID